MKKWLTFFLIISFCIYSNAQYITIDDQRTAQNLVEDVLLNNTGCASVSNFSVSGGSFASGENSYGYFNAAGTNFPFDEGLILTCGKANDAPGPNAGVISGSGAAWAGLDATSASILGESNTFNATVLEFDFVPLVSNMSFEYIFLSEEYEVGLMCNYSDVFGFLLKKASEPDSAYVNIALIPGTATPVKVTTVHPDAPGNCGPINEEYFDTFNGLNAPVDYAGQTVTLLAKSEVIPNETYHIKLIIADDADQIYDSAVFLKAGSFNIGGYLGEDMTFANNNPVCGDQDVVLEAETGVSYVWYQNGVILPSETNQTLIISPSLGDGIYTVDVDLGGGCISQAEIEIEFGPIVLVYDSTVASCRDLSTDMATFDLTDPILVNTITGGNTNLIIENYFESMIDYNSDPQVYISNPEFFETAIHQPVYALVVDQTTGCNEIATINLNILEPPFIKNDEDVYYCVNSFPDTIVLSSGNMDVDNLNQYSYLWGSGETTESIAINQIGDYEVTVTNNDGCVSSRTIHVLESSTPIIDNIFIADTKYPDRVSIEVITQGQGDYLYALDIQETEIDNEDLFQEENLFNNVLYGYHRVIIKDKNGCGYVNHSFILLEYQKFITPNNDGNYDTWNIDNMNTSTKFKAISDVFIFDRYGKILASIKPNGIGWDGRSNGKIVNSDSYWFVVELEDYTGKKITKRGHFSVR